MRSSRSSSGSSSSSSSGSPPAKKTPRKRKAPPETSKLSEPVADKDKSIQVAINLTVPLPAGLSCVRVEKPSSEIDFDKLLSAYEDELEEEEDDHDDVEDFSPEAQREEDQDPDPEKNEDERAEVGESGSSRKSKRQSSTYKVRKGTYINAYSETNCY